MVGSNQDQTVHHPGSHPEQAHQAPCHDPPPQLWEQRSEYRESRVSFSATIEENKHHDMVSTDHG